MGASNGVSDLTAAKAAAKVQETRDAVLASVSAFIDAIMLENRSLRRDVKNLCAKVDDLQDGYNAKSDEVEGLKRQLANAIDLLKNGGV